jgi:hypothetical protein
MRLWVKWSAWLCLSLMLWTAAAEPTHSHANRTASASCSICLVAHSASPGGTAGQGGTLFAAIGFLQEELVVTYARLDFSDSGIRGPPELL